MAAVAATPTPRPSADAAVIPPWSAGPESAAVAFAGDPPLLASAAQPSVLMPPVAPQAIAPSPEQLHRMRIEGLEVSNGVGTIGLAGRTARGLRGLGFQAARVSDYLDFSQNRTIILYRPGHLDKAKALRDALPHRVVLIPSRKLLRSEINVRLVIGHDLVGKRIFAWANSPQVVLAGVLAEWNAVLGRRVDLYAYSDAVSRIDAADGWRWS